MKSRLLVILGLTAAAGGAAFAALRGNGASTEGAAVVTPTCALPLDHGVSWTIGVESTVGGVIAGAPLDSTRASAPRFEGTLTLSAFQRDADSSTLLTARLTGVNEEEMGIAALDQPFVVRQSPDCRFLQFGFSASTTMRQANFLRSLLQQIEVVAPAEASVRWTARQTDSLGRYAATYDRSGATLTKRRQNYVQAFAPSAETMMSVEILESRLTATLPDELWVGNLAAAEAVRVEMRAKGSGVSDVPSKMRVSARVALERVGRVARLEPPTSLRWVSGEARPGLDESPPVELASPPPPPLAQVPIGSVLAEMSQLVAARGRGITAAGRLLSEWIRQNPREIDALRRLLLEGGIPEASRAAAYFGLEKAGTPEAHALLVELVATTELNVTDRVRAMSALSDVPNPSAETVGALAAVSAPADGKVYDEFHTSATMALGKLEHNTLESNPELAESVHRIVLERLQQPRSGQELVVAGSAVFNSRNPSYMQEVVGLLSGSSGAERKAAYRALPGMPVQSTAHLFLPAYEQEEEPKLRTLAVEAFVRQIGATEHGPAANVLREAADVLATESDAQTREQLIRLLGAGVKSGNAAARAALVSHYKREVYGPLLILIGQFVTAEELL